MKAGSCRIIGGSWRGRKIKFDDAEGLRPTTDRIRETVFNWLQPYIHQSRCLDVFAGSGVLGFEALSRGAQEVVFIEQNGKTVKNLKQSISMLDAENASIFHQDALLWLQSAKSDHRFNLVFLDPPFHADLLLKACAALNSSGCLADDAIIYVEHNIDTDIEMPENWLALKEKRAGQVAYKLFEHRVV
ncbi:MAG: 16S rRNA (guanine(966)-N(2))-methyltransferase RsmD [Gammaproteobacteria bacterium]|nr:16S rRNA (guanine(966)-N(2))-methyltransferase RsmD [Gammaproteobacteria bacterium]